MSIVPTNAQLMHEIDAIKAYLVAAQDVVKSGHMPELVGLKERVTVLCQSVQQAEREIQENCLPHLHVLIEQLNACEKAMREWHERQTVESPTS